MNPRSFLTLFLSLIAISSAPAQTIKCATVDANKLITEYHVAKKELSVLLAERDEYNKDRDERNKALVDIEAKIKALIAKIRKKAMPKSERDTLAEEYEDLISQHNAISKDLHEADMEQLRGIKSKIAEATRRLLDEIHGVISKHAKENKYHWVIDTSGVSNTQISPLLYARETTDITDEILAILNKDAPEEKEDAE